MYVPYETPCGSLLVATILRSDGWFVCEDKNHIAGIGHEMKFSAPLKIMIYVIAR